MPRRTATFCCFLLPVVGLLAVCGPEASAQTPAEARRLREQMVRDVVVGGGIDDERVVRAMRDTPRHEFMPLAQRKRAYLDMALPIGDEQTISAPFIVAYMTEQLRPAPSDKVLEIGTGSGYQAAVLSPLVKEVYTIEIVRPLGRRAERTLKRLNYRNVHTRIGDGYLGWPEAAPFDKIIVTCSPDRVPQPLVDQLREGGSIVVPVGERYRQNLYRLTKVDGKLEREVLQATLFVPMTGEAEAKRTRQPDPLRPALVNGGFESVLDGGALPEAWHHIRQAKVVAAEGADGGRYLQFTNDEPGRDSRALQGFAINGRKIRKLDVRYRVRGTGLRYGRTRSEWPRIAITFYDERRAVIDDALLPPLQGDFPWTDYREAVLVPLQAREAILRVGLLGGIGELAVENIGIAAGE